MSRPSAAERRAEGREARKSAPRSSHAEWVPGPDRRDPVTLLEEQNQRRVPWLVPLRHARMRVSPFTFFRGTARIMATDLARTPTSGLEAQLGGDAHLSNFGAYASPERQLVFDANDFDETLRGPWEWDLKRLTASFMVAARHLGFKKSDVRSSTAEVVRSYREAMAEFAAMGFLDLWYDHTTTDDIRQVGGFRPPDLDRRLDRFDGRARSKNSLQALRKLTVEVDGRREIRSDPPVLFSLREMPAEYDPATIEETARRALEGYKETLVDDRHALLDRFEPVDIGVKVVGVGSVGTRCFIMLLEGRDGDDPLFLQIKEAEASVLEEHLDPGPYDHHGRRVVEGQRMVQAQSDLFLGWTDGAEDRQFYVRQLRDWKGSAEVEGASPELMRFYARLCGHTLARGHARSGDPAAIHGYVGSSDRLDRSLTEFSERYADQNQTDYEAFQAAIADGRIPAADGI